MLAVLSVIAVAAITISAIVVIVVVVVVVVIASASITWSWLEISPWLLLSSFLWALYFQMTMRAAGVAASH